MAVNSDRSSEAAGALERALLGGRADLTREDVEADAHLSKERARGLWRALGFVDAAPDQPMFSAADVDALRRTTTLAEDRLLDERVVNTLARTLGQTMRRLAEAQVEILGDLMAHDEALVELAKKDPEQAVSQVVEQTTEWLPELEALLVYAYRRHVLAASQRVLAGVAGVTGEKPVVVGFCDIVNYTAVTRDMAGPDLADLVETFESTASDIVARSGGRVVKTLGDEVMFAADDPETGAEIGLALSEAFRIDESAALERLPTSVGEVRVGLAYGPALSHGGDLFGPVVNLASRCTGVARPGRVVCELELAQALQDSPLVQATRLRTLRVRGYGHLAASALRRRH